MIFPAAALAAGLGLLLMGCTLVMMRAPAEWLSSWQIIPLVLMAGTVLADPMVMAGLLIIAFPLGLLFRRPLSARPLFAAGLLCGAGTIIGQWVMPAMMRTGFVPSLPLSSATVGGIYGAAAAATWCGVVMLKRRSTI